MSKDGVRIGQLFGPYGPGSIYVRKGAKPVVFCGLDRWYLQDDMNDGGHRSGELEEYLVHEPRLLELLRHDNNTYPSMLLSPPVYRKPITNGNHDPNAYLHIPAFRFPSWHIPRGGIGRWVDMTQIDRTKSDRNFWQKHQGNLVPLRFISICPKGHMDDFPWRELAGCTNTNHTLQYYEGGGGDLSSIQVRCGTCNPNGKGNSLGGVTARISDKENGENQNANGPKTRLSQKILTINPNRNDLAYCRGSMVWHDHLDHNDQPRSCGESIYGSLLSALKVYIARTQLSILIPPQDPPADFSKFAEILKGAPAKRGFATQLLSHANNPPILNYKMFFLGGLEDLLCDDATRNDYRQKIRDPNFVDSFYERLMNPPFIDPATSKVTPINEDRNLSFRRVEYNCLTNPEPIKCEELETKNGTIPGGLEVYIDKITLVNRLRATKVLLGFDRVEPQPRGNQIDWELLFKTIPVNEKRWLPAYKSYGEGIFLNLKNQKVNDWITDKADFLNSRISDVYMSRFVVPKFLMPQDQGGNRAWAARYLVVHGLAHAIINQLVFDCGYSSASLRERLYVSNDPNVPMAGILIYTAAGDSEGTLGGLVRQGEPDRFKKTFLNALRRILWCSTDPVCSEVDYQGVDLTNRAACNSCILLPETSCETINSGLDRAVLIGTPQNRDAGLFSALAEQYLKIE